MIEIEKHIKRMKSRVYIENLKKYPDVINRLKEKYYCS
jgi:putative endonuclease